MRKSRRRAGGAVGAFLNKVKGTSRPKAKRLNMAHTEASLSITVLRA